MVSSRFAHRRRTRGTAAICHVAPPIIVPPYYPYPPTWPPDTFFMACHAEWSDWTGPHSVNWTMQLNRVPGEWIWDGESTPGPWWKHCKWHISPVDHWGNILLEGSDAGSPFTLVQTHLGMTWGSQAHYLITTWEGWNPEDCIGSAEFDF